MIKITIEDTDNNVLISKSVEADAGCAFGSVMAMYCASIDDLYSILLGEVLVNFHSNLHSDESMQAYWATYKLLQEDNYEELADKIMQLMEEPTST